jgi:F-type H+-transporting ATPase subunit b
MEFLTFLAVSAPAGGEEAGQVARLAQQFGVDGRILFAQIVNFCVVAFLLWRFAFKPVLSTIEERQQKIAEGLQHAEDMAVKLAETEARQVETLKQAQQDAQKIIAEAREAAKALLTRQTQEAAAQVEETLRKAREATELERERMIAEVRDEVAQLVVLTSAKVLDRELSDVERTRYSDTAAREMAS